MKRIISVINQKGGVGKTTTSTNLACGLSMKGNNVLLIDLDPQGHCTIGLGMADKCINTVKDVLLSDSNKKELEEVIYKTEFPQLSLAGANIHLSKVSNLLINEHFREQRLKEAIETQSDSYDYVIIDCHPSLGILEVNALYASNFLLVPTDTGRYSLEGFADLLDTIRQVKGPKNHIKDYLRILVTLYDSREKTVNDWVAEQLEDFQDVVLNTKIRRITGLKHTQIVEIPIMYYDKNSSGTKDYLALTNELLNIW